MEYILILTKSKTETTFFLDLLKKMGKEFSTLSMEEMEEHAFITALKEAKGSGKGSLNKVKTRLRKVVAGK